ncbi:hypothetical protein [Pasteurella sp. PK-2025]|uniref:hypothetical protein n=1 Tax=Pasteurella sp. PK-2025 TaxID=3413133 RepID=UPI003C7639BC
MTQNVGKELLNVPFPELVLKLGSAIAEAQYKMDLESIEIMKIMGQDNMVTIPTPTFQGDDGLEKHAITTSMIGAGFQPTFYQFAESIIEVKMTISMTEEKESVKEGKEPQYAYWSPFIYYSLGRNRYIRRRVLYSTPMDAKYTNKYSYHQEGESTLRTRLVPVPPNTIIQRFIDLKAMEMEKKLAPLNEAESGTHTAMGANLGQGGNVSDSIPIGNEKPKKPIPPSNQAPPDKQSNG